MNPHGTKRVSKKIEYENHDAVPHNDVTEGKITTVYDLCADIWQEIFDYFEVVELFNTFAYVIPSADQVLFSRNEHYQLRGLTIDDDTEHLPENMKLSCIISLTVRNIYCFDIIQRCIELRSLKLIGEAEWITSMIIKTDQTCCKLEQLSVDISAVGSISEILTCVASIYSLRRLEICADRFVEDVNSFCSVKKASKIEHLIVNSCSIFDWNQLPQILPRFVDMQLLSISLIDDNQKSIPSFYLHTATMTNLCKLKLNGLVCEDGFVSNQRWAQLLESAQNSIRICVNVFLQQDARSYFDERVKVTLRNFGLSLTSNNNDADYCMNDEDANCWWNLRGMIRKQ
ncbi:unnamed protein product [Adineta ricciae]|uniref:Uncharacterized protein n=1 Tax=Adineta ricciae TaxID=249248 RepID=A0A813VFT0_ADIRI|nr:unnamed protein product [Adineta ricciae]CAF1512754.1 unnamed protein product [Adineta ricciae]